MKITVRSGGLQAPIGYTLTTISSCSLNILSTKRTSIAYKHRVEARWIFGTSKDVMPTMAGNTPLVLVIYESLYEVSELLNMPMNKGRILG